MAFELLINFVDPDPTQRMSVKRRLIGWMEAVGRTDFVEGVIDGVETPLTQSELVTGITSEDRLDFAPLAIFEQTRAACHELLVGLRAEFGKSISGQITEISDESWSRCWRESFSPLETQNFFIVPLADPAPTPPGKRRIEICEGHGAFGTGQHATTRAVIKLLESHLPLWGSGSLLDVGTGTGIYLVLSSMLGVDDLVGTELSEDLVAVARENCEIAGVKADVHMSSTLEFTRPFDVVVANILAPVLYQLMPDMVRHLTANGRLVLAGFIEKEEQALVNRAAEFGLKIDDSVDDSGWRCLAFSKASRKFS